MENTTTYYTDIDEMMSDPTQGMAELIQAEKEAYQKRAAYLASLSDDDFDAEMEATEFEAAQRYDYDAYVNSRY